MNNFSTQVALVTGGSVRIGRGIAIRLAQEGWSVAVHYDSAADAANATVKEIRAKGGQAFAFKADFRNEDETHNLIPQIGSQLGEVTCLVNNASVFEEDNIKNVSRKTWDIHMEVNLWAPLVLSQVLRSNLTTNAQGNIINIVDQRVENLTPHFLSYTVSKSALWTLTQTLAGALAPHIRVNAVGPGPTLPSNRQSAIDFDNQVATVPLKRAVEVSEICDAIVFILQTPSLTGQLINVDSGQHLGWAFFDSDSKLTE